MALPVVISDVMRRNQPKAKIWHVRVLFMLTQCNYYAVVYRLVKKSLTIRGVAVVV